MKTDRIWYDRPAERWKEAFPIGNGYMGGMVYGGVGEDCICLNEESIWEKPVDDFCNPKALKALPKLRQLLFEKRLSEAQKLANDCFVSVPKKFGAFTPFADLILRESDVIFSHSDLSLRSDSYTGYRRELDLETGILHVTYEKCGVRFYREYFASWPDHVIVIRCRHESDHPMDFHAFFRKGRDNCCTCHETDHSIVYYEDQLSNKGVRFCGAIKGVSGSGQAQSDYIPWKMGYVEPYMAFEQTNDFVMYVSVTTDYQGKDPHRCFDYVNQAAQKGYEQVKADHIRDYSELYHRFELHLQADDPDDDRSLSDILDSVRSGAITPSFTELYTNFTRYMLISASRAGGLPSNLQGVWNDLLHPGCESDYHTNINLQINYWTAQAWGLPECEEPLVKWMEDLLPGGRDAAARTYGAKGWMVHHCSDIFGYAWPNFDPVGLWPVGGSWMCRHLYEQWQYTRDNDMMRTRFYPIIRENVEFILDFLVRAPKESACPGCLVTVPSISPENTYILENGESGMLTYACTMDIEIIQDLFALTMEMIEEIRKTEPEFDKDLVLKMQEVLSDLPPVRISPSHGGIQEWIEDYKEAEPGHRHVSHLYGIYPGKSISDAKTPELAKAARQTLENRYKNGYEGQGWSVSWIGCIRARLGDAERAYDAVTEAYQKHLLPNLMINAHGMPQVGDAFGLPSVLLEMLVQSHEGQIVLLPALPDALSSGSVRGLRVRGGHIIDMEWRDKVPVRVSVRDLPDSVSMPVVTPDGAVRA